MGEKLLVVDREVELLYMDVMAKDTCGGMA